MIYLGADHAGFQLKETIKKYLSEHGYLFEDLGNQRMDKDDDYPDYALAVADKVAGTKNKGILFCGSAIGMVIAANKVAGTRAGHILNPYTAKQSKEHDDVNVAVLASKLTTASQAKNLVSIWLKARFSSAKRHQRRVRKIIAIENRSYSPARIHETAEK